MEKYNREEFEEVIVNIGRVTKVVKGGRRFRFTALVVVGNKKVLLALVSVKLKRFLMLFVKRLMMHLKTSLK